jgi:hypothetical protein
MLAVSRQPVHRAKKMMPFFAAKVKQPWVRNDLYIMCVEHDTGIPNFFAVVRIEFF